MGTLGIFAGRGDVVLAMLLAFVIGVYIGWKLRGGWLSLSNKFGKKGDKQLN